MTGNDMTSDGIDVLHRQKSRKRNSRRNMRKVMEKGGSELEFSRQSSKGLREESPSF